MTESLRDHYELLISLWNEGGKKKLVAIPRLRRVACSNMGIVALVSFCCFIILPGCLSANSVPNLSTPIFESVVYPPDANLINVRDYGAKGDSLTDDTAAIRQAVQQNLMQHKTLFFPTGTYLISDVIEWKRDNGSYGAFLTWQGEGSQTTIKLQDRAQLFQDPKYPQALVRTGSIGTKDGSGPRAHSNYIFDLTFDVGKDNPGAIGLDFNASNTGAIENVAILSQDGKGKVGLELTREVGPCLIKNVTIKGFDRGINVGSALYSITFENIYLAEQNQVGIFNDSNVLAVRKLTSVNKVPALINQGDWSGPSVLIDSELHGGSSREVAVKSPAHILLRNVNVSGYKAALQSNRQLIKSSYIEEFVSAQPLALFDSPAESLNLPIEETPEFIDRDLNNWVNVKDYGANPNDRLDDSAAVQKAIDSGKTTVYFPNGEYRIEEPVTVRGEVRRLIGFNSPIIAPNGFLRLENDRHPVIIERFNCFGDRCKLENAASQPVVLRHFIGALFSTTSEGGTWFVENVVSPRLHIGKGHKLYARQLNCESPPPEPLFKNDGGQAWILGYKTEFGNTVAATLNGGRTEILGGLFYPSQRVKDPTIPLFINRDSTLSAVYREIAFGSTYGIHVAETRKGKMKTLKRDTLGKGKMVAIPLYRGGTN